METYVNGQAIKQVPLVDGQVIHLAISGPRILLNILPDPTESVSTPGIDSHQEGVMSTPELLFTHQNEEKTEVNLRKQLEFPTNHLV
ncbi:MAG: hypothetical protein RSE13_11810 [Planktothrix sp. GU0601_MAG3]|nr:MAG: hypothetical protein RSE13_11810 [Planktothrix sp. GU0601_MAG3]